MDSFEMPAFIRSVAETAGALLQNPTPGRQCGDAARAVQEAAEIALARHRVNPEAIACRAGCGHCCIVNVAVLDPEADAILDYLRNKVDAAELSRLAERAGELSRSILGLDAEERIMMRQPCLFLNAGGMCGIYPVRPLLCRGVTSTDPEQCREAIALLALGENVPILANLFQQELFHGAFSALAAALKAAGMDDRSRPLTHAVHQRLKQP